MSQNNPFNLMMQHCRLSIREAAILHRVDVKQIGHWQSGRRVAPPGVINELRELDAAIQEFGDALIQLTSDLLDEAGDAAMLTNVERDETPITFACSVTDQQARSRGLPFMACHAAAVANAISIILNPVELADAAQDTPDIEIKATGLRGRVVIPKNRD